MIVDTAALVAILIQEPGWEKLRAALLDEPARLPTPAKVEFLRVARSERLELGEIAESLLAEWEAMGLEIAPFTDDHARLATAANAVHGSGLRTGGKLSLLDLMVYAVAKDRGEPLFCTGKDFAATELVLHPACRRE